MNRGAWHQFGDRSQKLALEQLEQGAGVGVIISPRDLPHHLAIEYSQQYHHLGVEVLIDQQFYVPGYTNAKLESYPVNNFRQTVSQLNAITDEELKGLTGDLESVHSDLAANGVIAPAVVYEAGRGDIVQLNARLFEAAKTVGKNLNIPTYATVMLGQSVTSATRTIDSILSHATSLDPDGWYYGFEFSARQRVPSTRDAILRCCSAGLELACTGKPVLHAFAGPLGILSLGFGATGIGVGHSQNLWQFSRSRWEEPSGEGGGGDAPPRFFSNSLWGTIIYPDESIQLPPDLRDAVLTPSSPFSAPVFSNVAWSRWDANKHLVYVLCNTIGELANEHDPRENGNQALSLLDSAVKLHAKIAESGLSLKDDTSAYQSNWHAAMQELLDKRSDEFDYLDLLG